MLDRIDGSVIPDDLFDDVQEPESDESEPQETEVEDESDISEPDDELDVDEETGPQQSTQAVDYEQMAKGLQGRVQREIEYRRQLEEELRQLRQQQIREQVAHLPAEEQQAYIQQYQQWEEFQQAQQQLAQERLMLNEAAKEIVLSRAAQQYGIPVAELQQVAEESGPRAMMLYAQRQAKLRRQERKQKRKARRQDDFGGASVTQRKAKKPLTLDEAEAYLASLSMEDIS